MKLVMEPADYQQAREAMEGVLDYVPTNQQIDVALAARIGLSGKAYTWGWSDTDVRDELCEMLDGMDKE